MTRTVWQRQIFLTNFYVPTFLLSELLTWENTDWLDRSRTARYYNAFENYGVSWHFAFISPYCIVIHKIHDISSPSWSQPALVRSLSALAAMIFYAPFTVKWTGHSKTFAHIRTETGSRTHRQISSQIQRCRDCWFHWGRACAVSTWISKKISAGETSRHIFGFGNGHPQAVYYTPVCCHTPSQYL